MIILLFLTLDDLKDSTKMKNLSISSLQIYMVFEKQE